MAYLEPLPVFHNRYRNTQERRGSTTLWGVYQTWTLSVTGINPATPRGHVRPHTISSGSINASQSDETHPNIINAQINKTNSVKRVRCVRRNWIYLWWSSLAAPAEFPRGILAAQEPNKPRNDRQLRRERQSAQVPGINTKDLMHRRKQAQIQTNARCARLIQISHKRNEKYSHMSCRGRCCSIDCSRER